MNNLLCFWTGFTGFYGSFLYFSLEEGSHFFAFHPRFKRDRLERQKNHVYHVNPVKYFLFSLETVEPF